MIESRWLTIQQAQKYANISRNKLMELIHRGDICASKRMGRWRIDKESIDNFFLYDDVKEKEIINRIKKYA